MNHDISTFITTFIALIHFAYLISVESRWLEKATLFNWHTEISIFVFAINKLDNKMEIVV